MRILVSSLPGDKLKTVVHAGLSWRWLCSSPGHVHKNDNYELHLLLPCTHSHMGHQRTGSVHLTHQGLLGCRQSSQPFSLRIRVCS